jgi:hypothetical protein
MPTLQIIHYAAIAAGYLLALARLTDRARPFWSFLPAKIQPFLPAVLVVLPDLATGLQGVKSVEDVLNVALTAAGAVLIAMRGAVPAAHFEQLSPEAKKEIADVRAKTPPAVSPPTTVLVVILAAMVGASQASCSNGGAPKSPAALGAKTSSITRVAFNALTLIVQRLSDENAAWMHTVVATGDPAIADAAAPTARKLTGLLDDATEVLSKARTELADDSKARDELRKLLPLVKGALELLDAIGRPPPKELGEGYDFLAGFLGDA